MLNDAYPEAAVREVPASPPRGQRLTDKLLVAFHQACDQSEIEVANALIALVEAMLRRSQGIERRRQLENLVTAYERLWFLKHASRDDVEEMMSVAANT